ncbi:MAG: GAF domain-containing protein [Candidatus Portnoybacteria bacterium]|nr:GAF domain-containing protein [Candidatus Portnoybacteria bacterium]
MNAFALSGLLIGIFCLLFGIFVYWKGRQNKSNKLWAIFCFSTAAWGFGGYKIGLIKDPLEALFWWRVTYVGIIFIPVLFYHFVYLFLGLKKRKLLYLIYCFGFFFLILEWTPWADLFFGLSNMGFLFSSFYWVFPPTTLFSFFVFSWFSIVVYSHYELYKALKKSFGLKRTQIKYFFLGMAVAFAGGGTCFMPCFNIKLYPILNFAVPLYPAIIGYAILKYRLMDIRMAIKRSTIFSGVVIMITAAYALAAFLLSWVVFGGVYTFRTQIIVGLIVAFLVAIGFRPLYDWLKRITDTFLFKGEYKPQELMADISDVLSRTLDLDKVIGILREQISRALRVGKMEVVVLEEDGSQISKAALGKLIAYFKKQREVLVLEELKRKQAEKVGFDKGLLLIRDLEKLKTALAVPLLVKEKLVGLFLLGAKKSGDMFTNEDIKTLEAIAAQAAIAVENARLYEEMKDFSKTLQKEVNRQTKSLREANIRLEQLDKAKSEFISLASHQLRTPLSIIKGYISMILEGTWGETNKKQKEHLEKVYLSNERLIKLVEDLLTVSRIESGRLDFNFQPLALDNLTESMVKEFSQMSAKKGLYLKYLKPEKPLPLVKVDSLKIRQVIQNLIENAIHYTKKGGATILLKAEKNKVRFSIQDTGIGISSEEQVTLFEKFSRGKEVTKMHTEGAGLGLYLAAKLIDAHQGKIWVESQGKGKGSTFYFELPAKRKK